VPIIFVHAFAGEARLLNRITADERHTLSEVGIHAAIESDAQHIGVSGQGLYTSGRGPACERGHQGRLACDRELARREIVQDSRLQRAHSQLELS